MATTNESVVQRLRMMEEDEETVYEDCVEPKQDIVALGVAGCDAPSTLARLSSAITMSRIPTVTATALTGLSEEDDDSTFDLSSISTSLSDTMAKVDANIAKYVTIQQPSVRTTVLTGMAAIAGASVLRKTGTVGMVAVAGAAALFGCTKLWMKWVQTSNVERHTVRSARRRNARARHELIGEGLACGPIQFAVARKIANKVRRALNNPMTMSASNSASAMSRVVAVWEEEAKEAYAPTVRDVEEDLILNIAHRLVFVPTEGELTANEISSTVGTYNRRIAVSEPHVAYKEPWCVPPAVLQMLPLGARAHLVHQVSWVQRNLIPSSWKREVVTDIPTSLD